MPTSKQYPLAIPSGGTEHDFGGQSRAEWETSVFDRAAHFAVIEMRHDRRETRFAVLPWAVRFARDRDDACLYAVTKSGRFALIDRERWPEWERRWRGARGMSAADRPVAQEKPHRGTITEWSTTSAPHGLGYCVSGRMGGKGVLTSSVLSREGSEVETLNWRYTLGEGAKQ